MTPNGFDRLARPYRWMEYLSFGPLLQRCRTRYLPRVSHVRNALVLGDGDGRFTARLLQAAPHARITAIDASSAMLAQLRRNCYTDTTRLQTHQAEIPCELSEHIYGQTYDLIATHFFIDCLTTGEVTELAQALRPSLTENAQWLISDFAIARGPMRIPSALIVNALYRSFRMLTGLRTQQLPLHSEALRACGYIPVQQVRMMGGLLVAELWQHGPRDAA